MSARQFRQLEKNYALVILLPLRRITDKQENKVRSFGVSKVKQMP